MSELKVNEAYQSFLTAKAASERLSYSDERDVELLKMLIQEAAADGKFSISKSGLSAPVLLHIKGLGYEVEMDRGPSTRTTGPAWEISWDMTSENE